MNAKLEITILNTPILVSLSNVLMEQFPDGVMVNADDCSMTIFDADVESITSNEDQDCFVMKNNSVLTFNWT